MLRKYFHNKHHSHSAINVEERRDFLLNYSTFLTVVASTSNHLSLHQGTIVRHGSCQEIFHNLRQQIIEEERLSRVICLIYSRINTKILSSTASTAIEFKQFATLTLLMQEAFISNLIASLDFYFTRTARVDKVSGAKVILLSPTGGLFEKFICFVVRNMKSE